MNNQTRKKIKQGLVNCVICGQPITNPKEYSIEHEPPKSRQHELGKSRLYPAHKRCNNAKGALTMEEYRLFLELLAKKNGQQYSR